jgi:DNA primase
MHNLNAQQIVAVLDKLGIEHATLPNFKNWLLCKCANPAHNDKNMSNAGISLNSGMFNCFSCGYKKHIINIVQDHLKIEYKQALEYINKGYNIYSNTYKTTHSNVQLNAEVHKTQYTIYQFTHISLNPDKYYYTKVRGFTKDFCEQFEIRHSISHPYLDYFIIPIEDKKKGISLFEARRLMEYEKLKELFQLRGNCNYLKNMFDTYQKENNLTIKNIKTHNPCKYDEDLLYYLLKSKTYYPSNSSVKETIWNIDNLNYDEDLWLAEGLGSMPKLYNHISKNCSCIFGAQVSPQQLLYLLKFKRVILIPDNDLACYAMIEKLHYNKVNIWVSPIKYKDDQKEFVKAIEKNNPIEGLRYLIQNEK